MTPAEVTKLLGPTQAEVAANLGLNQSTVSRWKKFGIPFLRQRDIQVRTAGVLQADLAHAPKKHSAPKNTVRPDSENHNGKATI